jgi:hypothetical protein
MSLSRNRFDRFGQNEACHSLRRLRPTSDCMSFPEEAHGAQRGEGGRRKTETPAPDRRERSRGFARAGPEATGSAHSTTGEGDAAFLAIWGRRGAFSKLTESCDLLVAMPSRSFTGPGAFGPEALAVMSEAYEAALASQPNVVRKVIAGRSWIIVAQTSSAASR